MADGTEVIQEQSSQVSTEVADQMAISLGLNNPAQIQQTQQALQVQNTPEAAAAELPFEFKFDTFKEKYGYEKPEDVLTEIETLRAYKATPPTPTVEPIKFETPESEKLFKAWQAGKEDEVYNYLAEKRQLETLTAQEVTEHNADQLIKLGMQIKFKDLGLSEAEINHKFNKQYTVPKAPVQGVDEIDEDFSLRQDAHKSQVSEILMDKMIEAKIAKKELEAAKPRLVLPTIDEKVDENYAQYLKALEDSKNVNNEAIEAYNKLTPKDLEKRIKFTDEANKVDLEFQYEPDAETYAEAQAIAKDFNLFWNKFRNQDGSPDRKKFLSAIAMAINPDKAIIEALKQSKNATIKASLADNDTGSGLVRQLPQQSAEPSELDKQMQYSLQPFQQRGR